jgi:hypothetical protein
MTCSMIWRWLAVALSGAAVGARAAAGVSTSGGVVSASTPACGVSTSEFQQFKEGAADLFHSCILAIEALSSATYLILAGAMPYLVVRGLGIGNASSWQVPAPLRNRWMERSDLDEPRKVLAAHKPGCLIRWEEARCESTGMVGTLVQAALPAVITR